MTWVLVWLVCTTTGCWPELVEQDFPDRASCAYALAWYQAHHGVVAGVCQAHEP